MASKKDWVVTDLAGLRKNSSLTKAVLELAAQNPNDTDAKNITIEIAPDRHGLARLLVTDDDPVGYLDLSHSYTMFAPSTKAGDDTKAGIFNVGEKEFLAFCNEGMVTSTTGTVTFRADGRRGKSTAHTSVGSVHDFILKMNRVQQAEIIARLREVIFHADKNVTINGEVVPHRPEVLETTATLPLVVADPEDPYAFVNRDRVVRITLHEPGTGGPTLHVVGMPVQPIDCVYSVNVHGRLRLDQARDQVKAPVVARILAAVANVLAEHDALTADDAEGWARTTLGKYSTPKAAKDIFVGIYGADAMVANPSDREANARAASEGRAVVHGGSLTGEAWGAVARARDEFATLAPSTSKEFGAGVDGMLTNEFSPEEWTFDAHRVVDYVKRAFAVCFPNDGTITVRIYGGDEGNCIAAGGRNYLAFNQGDVGWAWFEHSNDTAILSTIIHEFAHHEVHEAGHSYAWGAAASRIGAKLAVWGELP